MIFLVFMQEGALIVLYTTDGIIKNRTILLTNIYSIVYKFYIIGLVPVICPKYSYLITITII